MFVILKELEIVALYSNSIKDFKTSYYWIIAFIKRNKLALQWHIRISQKLLD